MRQLLIAIPFALFACSGGETPPADEPATAMAAGLTEADVAGTWEGTAMLQGTDSVFLHWTQVCANGTCRGTSQEVPDTIVSTYTIDADSAMASSTPVADPTLGGAMVVQHWVVRIDNAAVTGHGWATLADMPDSVVTRITLTGTKMP